VLSLQVHDLLDHLCLYWTIIDAINSSDHIALDGRTIGKQRIERMIQEAVMALLEVLSPHFPGEIE
jgi:hypothetical protein